MLRIEWTHCTLQPLPSPSLTDSPDASALDAPQFFFPSVQPFPPQVFVSTLIPEHDFQIGVAPDVASLIAYVLSSTFLMSFTLDKSRLEKKKKQKGRAAMVSEPPEGIPCTINLVETKLKLSGADAKTGDKPPMDPSKGGQKYVARVQVYNYAKTNEATLAVLQSLCDTATRLIKSKGDRQGMGLQHLLDKYGVEWLNAPQTFRSVLSTVHTPQVLDSEAQTQNGRERLPIFLPTCSLRPSPQIFSNPNSPGDQKQVDSSSSAQSYSLWSHLLGEEDRRELLGVMFDGVRAECQLRKRGGSAKKVFHTLRENIIVTVE